MSIPLLSSYGKLMKKWAKQTCVAGGTRECFGDASTSLVQQTCWLRITSLLSDGWVQGRYKSLLQALVPKV